MITRLFKRFLGLKLWALGYAVLAWGGLKILLTAIGMEGTFYIVGLAALTVGAVKISETAGWITFGVVVLTTSVYAALIVPPVDKSRK